MHDFENQRFLLLSLTGFMVSTTLPLSKYHITHQLWQLESFLPMSPMFCHKEVNCRHGRSGQVGWRDGVPIILVVNVLILCVPCTLSYQFTVYYAHKLIAPPYFHGWLNFPKKLIFFAEKKSNAKIRPRKSPHFCGCYASNATFYWILSKEFRRILRHVDMRMVILPSSATLAHYIKRFACVNAVCGCQVKG